MHFFDFTIYLYRSNLASFLNELLGSLEKPIRLNWDRSGWSPCECGLGRGNAVNNAVVWVGTGDGVGTVLLGTLGSPKVRTVF